MITRIITFVAGVFFVISCRDASVDSVDPSPDGILSLPSAADFFRETSNLSQLPAAEFRNFESKHGYISYRSILDQAYLEMEGVTTEAELSNLLMKYGDMLAVNGSEVRPRIESRVYQSVVNRDGIYGTAGFLNKVVGDYIVTGPIGRYEELVGLNEVAWSEPQNKILEWNGFRIARFQGLDPAKAGRVNAACGDFIDATATYDPNNCKNDRKVILRARSVVYKTSDYQGDWYQPHVDVYVLAEKKTLICNWVGYTTEMQYQDISFSIWAWAHDANQYPVPQLYNRVPGHLGPQETSYLQWLHPVGEPVLNFYITPNPFVSFYGRATTRGTDGLWAVADCH